jgi:hypothetical protein
MAATLRVQRDCTGIPYIRAAATPLSRDLYLSSASKCKGSLLPMTRDAAYRRIGSQKVHRRNAASRSRTGVRAHALHHSRATCQLRISLRSSVSACPRVRVSGATRTECVIHGTQQGD